MQFRFRYWDRDDPQDGRAYLDVWTEDGSLVSQQLIPRGLEDAFFELVCVHCDSLERSNNTKIGIDGSTEFDIKDGEVEV